MATILIIEGIREDRLFLKKRLQQEFSVITLSSVSEAIAFSQSHKFEVAVISVNERKLLTAMREFQVLKVTCKHEFKAIAITNGLEDFHDTCTVIHAGFSAVITKPLCSKTLINIIEPALRKETKTTFTNN